MADSKPFDPKTPDQERSMRASSVNHTAKKIGSSNRLAKRTMLLSLVLASSSLSSSEAQQPSPAQGQTHAAGLIQNSDFARSYGNRVVSRVRQNTARGGQVRSNPFFVPSQTRQVTGDVQLTSQNEANVRGNAETDGRAGMVATSRQAGIVGRTASHNAGGENRSTEYPVAGTHPRRNESAGNAFAQQSTRRQTSRLQTVAAPFLQPLETHTSAAYTNNQIRPVAETRDADAVAESAQPIVFSFTDDAEEIASPDSLEVTTAAADAIEEPSLGAIDEAIETISTNAALQGDTKTGVVDDAEVVDESVGELPEGFVIQEAPLIDFTKSLPKAVAPVAESSDGISLSLSDETEDRLEPETPDDSFADPTGSGESMDVGSLAVDALEVDAFEVDAIEVDALEVDALGETSTDLADIGSPVMLAPVVDLARQVPLPEELHSVDDTIRVNPNVPASEVKPPSSVGAIQVNRAKNTVPLVSQEDGRAPVTVAMPPIEIEETLEASAEQHTPLLAAVPEPRMLPGLGAESAASEPVELAVPINLNGPVGETARDDFAALPELPPPTASAPEKSSPAIVPNQSDSVARTPTSTSPLTVNPRRPATSTPNDAVIPMPVFADRPPSITELTEPDQTPLIGSPVEVDPARNYESPPAKAISAKQKTPEPDFASPAESGNVNLASMHRRGDNRGMGFPRPTPTLQAESTTDAESLPQLPKSPAASQSNRQTVVRPEATDSFEPNSFETAGNQIVLRLRRGQVRSMTIGGTLRGVNIADKETCQAFAAGANEFKLIGTGLGTTELTVWADVRSGKPTQKQTFRIVVSESLDATGDQVTERTDLLNDSIQQAFPTASVLVTQRQGQLFVEGECPSESVATQIIRLVRKSCLIPVQDKLVVR
ncbi:pilus assembly protein N-terminal domain-containing protein [Roseiconus lacunae]|uniref:pilus assembly protein N-terminal domain-containing protein n=1 Tax=Roseiconus lacunae TaxID=2605694 RepID=UPI001E4F5CF9|nr:pilus assembly protein N-terminal domain-containing protein [Roseiconus lacunae]MCD0461574.1 pilus assembly protein N-terminal domain-containing protein [Roseiconus lacunae]